MWVEIKLQFGSVSNTLREAHLCTLQTLWSWPAGWLGKPGQIWPACDHALSCLQMDCFHALQPMVILITCNDFVLELVLQVLDRGERIELLVDKTDHLQQESFVFRREARQLKNKLWWKNLRLWLIIAGVAILLLYIAIAVICSSTFHCSK